MNAVADLAENIGGSGKYELNIIIEIHKSYIQFHPKKYHRNSSNMRLKKHQIYYIPTREITYPKLRVSKPAYSNACHMQNRKTIAPDCYIYSMMPAWNPTNQPEQLNKMLKQISKNLK